MTRKTSTDVAQAAKRGRPSTLTPELQVKVLEAIEAGKTLRQIEREGIAKAGVVMTRARSDEEFAKRYARAMEIRAERMAEELLEIADDGRNDTYTDDDGNTRTDTDVIQRSKLRVDTRKWLLAKMLPKKYGDKLQLGGAEDLPPIKQDVTIDPGEAYKAMLERGGK